MSSSAGSSSGAKIRQVILFLILLVAIAGLVYEFAVARPTFEANSEAIQELQNNAGKEGDYITDENVHTELGGEPAEVKPIGDAHKLEIYRYRRGIPIRFYSLAVGYRKMNDKWVLQTSWENNENPPNEEWIVSMDETNKGVTGGGGGGGRSAPGGGGTVIVTGGMAPPSGGDDKGGDDKSGDDKSGDDKSGDDKGGDDQAGDDQAGNDQAGDDQAGDDAKSDDGTGSDDADGDDGR